MSPPDFSVFFTSSAEGTKLISTAYNNMLRFSFQVYKKEIFCLGTSKVAFLYGFESFFIKAQVTKMQIEQ